MKSQLKELQSLIDVDIKLCLGFVAAAILVPLLTYLWMSMPEIRLPW